MMDKGLGPFVKALFGAGGIVIIIIAWVRVMDLSDRIMFTLIGLSGISFAVSTLVPFRYILTRIGIIRNIAQIQPGKE
jgi:hypothetical protein